eukprot:520689_1
MYRYVCYVFTCRGSGIVWIQPSQTQSKILHFSTVFMHVRALYFKLMVNQRDVVMDCYWDCGVISCTNEGQGRTLLASLVSYVAQHIEFEMLLSDKALNIMEYFVVDEDGVPQWNVAQDK